MFTQSIRFKIILLYMMLSAATLSLFSVLLYRNFENSLYDNTDDLLRLKAAGIVNSIEAYWETERNEITRSQAARGSIFTKINNVNFIKLAGRWIKDKSDDPELVNIVVHIFDAQGRVIASSKDLSDTMTMRPSIFEYALKGSPRFDNFHLESTDKGPMSLRALTKPVFEERRVAYIVQVASNLTPVQSELNHLKALLFLLVPVTVILTGMAGSFLVRVTLNPVDDMVRGIREIKADNLRSRIPVPRTKDEIMRLAETFNEMLARLERAFSTQRQFMQDVSHELKTPLTVIKGEMEVTLKKTRTREEYEYVLSSSLEEIDKIREILDNLLILARFESKEVSGQMRPLELRDILEKAMGGISVLAEQKNIRISLDAPEPMTVNGHENQLRRLVVNLVDNAIKYTSPGGSVSVSLKRDGDLAIADVADTGMGIPDEELPHIFDRFYRVDKARSSEGFGLGLSIVKSIALAHGGDVKVKSRLGEGTTFTVFLPLAATSERPTRLAAPLLRSH